MKFDRDVQRMEFRLIRSKSLPNKSNRSVNSIVIEPEHLPCDRAVSEGGFYNLIEREYGKQVEHKFAVENRQMRKLKKKLPHEMWIDLQCFLTDLNEKIVRAILDEDAKITNVFVNKIKHMIRIRKLLPPEFQRLFGRKQKDEEDAEDNIGPDWTARPKNRQESWPSHPAFKARAKFLAGQAGPVDAIGIKQTIKSVFQAYQTRFHDLRDSQDTLTSLQQDSMITMIEFIYDNLQLKYGNSLIARRKFFSLLSACKLYSGSNSRVHVFCRFLGLFDEFEAKAIFLMQDVTEEAKRITLNFQVSEQDEEPAIPTHRAVELVKLFLA